MSVEDAVARSAPAWAVFRADTFAGEVALVTGAASGMGEQTALAFAAHGARVIAVDLDGDRLAEVVRRCPPVASGPHVAVTADLSAEAGVQSTFAAVDELGRLDHVATCAAVMSTTRMLDLDRARWQRVFDINVGGTFYVVQEAYRRMLPRGAGTIVVVGSDAGKRGGGGMVADAAYAASKASVLSVVKSCAREFAGSGVRINALTPGPSETPMTGGLSDELRARIGAGLPIRRMGRADEMAAAILFLSSPGASYVYGASFNVDGGSMFE